jgi:hypothetical protein
MIINIFVNSITEFEKIKAFKAKLKFLSFYSISLKLNSILCNMIKTNKGNINR